MNQVLENIIILWSVKYSVPLNILKNIKFFDEKKLWSNIKTIVCLPKNDVIITKRNLGDTKSKYTYFIELYSTFFFLLKELYFIFKI